MNQIFDIDVICEHKKDATIVPIKFQLTNDDGDQASYRIRAFKPVPNNHGCHTTMDGVYVIESTQIFECKVVIFGKEQLVRLYYEPSSGSTWKLSI